MLFNVLTTLVCAAVASASVLKSRQGPQLVTRCTVPNTVALTFDDGPYIYLNEIVDTLDAAGAKGTFFFNGCIYDPANRARIKYAYDHGHQVASHTWAHRDLTSLSWDQIHDEMWRVEQALARITGATPAFMRPPYGNYNNLVLDASRARGQSVVYWDFDSEDSAGASVQRSRQLYDQATSTHPPTILTLNHETYQTTAREVLPYAIQRLKAAGYRLVSLADCVGQSPYQSVVGAGTPDSTPDVVNGPKNTHEDSEEE
ncbi:carbohydrate esterase family 4 protein [Coprinopsis marcescibilis]|uniref:Carbohydrate esterase family 4 protein n=1 Tax=Coprinopsis marcescibilis TaxID=230819 RepID=A0A5C3KQ56_COPMA|nr:carbohydrate esterase family 4 protein [Coprinopsis marcescibilis]